MTVCQLQPARPHPTTSPPSSLTLAKAFHDDPIKIFLSGGKALTTEQVVPFFDAFARIQVPHDETYVTPGLEAAALWAPPGQWKVPFTKILRYSPTLLEAVRHRFIPNLSVLTDIEKLHPEEPHYYLEFIGTDPAHQGKGFGRRCSTRWSSGRIAKVWACTWRTRRSRTSRSTAGSDSRCASR